MTGDSNVNVFADWPIAIVEDRYNGAYSGGAWIAISQADERVTATKNTRIEVVLFDGPHGEDPVAKEFWADPPDWVAVGATPAEALANLKHKTPHPNVAAAE